MIIGRTGDLLADIYTAKGGAYLYFTVALNLTHLKGLAAPDTTPTSSSTCWFIAVSVRDGMRRKEIKTS